MRVAILGATGMLGRMVLSYFLRHTNFDLLVTSREEFAGLPSKRCSTALLDATSSISAEMRHALKSCDVIINCIGLIKQKINDSSPDDVSRAILVNAVFPHRLQQAVTNQKTRIIQIATDCVYSGMNGRYHEQSPHDGHDVYGKSKSLGEVGAPNFCNLRCSIIGPEAGTQSSLLGWFLGQNLHAVINGFTNHTWNGITTYHFARIVHGIILSGTWPPSTRHVLPADSLTKAALLRIFAERFDRRDIAVNDMQTPQAIDRSLITRFPKDNTALWQAAGFGEPPTIAEMIASMPGEDYLHRGRHKD